MVKVILYPDGDEVRVLHPRVGVLPALEVARKDVPAGVPFRIVDAADLPPEVNYRSALSADFSAPDGVGLGPEQWRAERNAQSGGQE